ncbi:MAG: nickel-dependent lactate racemase [Candidatus Heimdallarchaeota archaeon]|nr:nickel-dependent lactate racemase [Candidatus Heimdallarchaeota archaeon]
MAFKIPYGEETIQFKLPDHWQLVALAEPQKKKGFTQKKIAKKLKKIFQDPIGCEPLKDLIEFTERVVIVVDDISRPTPTQMIIEPLIDYLTEEIGLPKGNINIIFGLGIHRNMTQEDAEKKLGEKIARVIHWENHHPYKNCVSLGQSPLGTPVKINKTFMEADFTIAIGLIEPHLWAGYSGGYKAIIPGISGIETIVKNHELVMEPDAKVGNIETNPLRRDIDMIGERIQLGFLINCIMNIAGEICEIVGGGAIAAHSKGVDVARDMYEIPVKETADVVITSAAPLGIDFRQSSKAAFNTTEALRKGGVMIVTSPCPEGVGNLRVTEKTPKRGFIKFLTKVLPSAMLMSQVRKQGYGIEDAPSVYQMFKFIAKKNYLFVTKGFTEEDREKVFVADHATTLEEAFTLADKLLKNEEKKKTVKVTIFPYGGSSYPRMEEE